MLFAKLSSSSDVVLSASALRRSNAAGSQNNEDNERADAAGAAGVAKRSIGACNTNTANAAAACATAKSASTRGGSCAVVTSSARRVVLAHAHTPVSTSAAREVSRSNATCELTLAGAVASELLLDAEQHITRQRRAAGNQHCRLHVSHSEQIARIQTRTREPNDDNALIGNASCSTAACTTRRCMPASTGACERVMLFAARKSANAVACLAIVTHP
jgi:hypothetical protein